MNVTHLIGAATVGAMLSAGTAMAATPVAIGMSGWTGFGPLTLAKEAGIFEKNGLDVTIHKIPQASRGLALASGDIQCAATTVETWLIWNANNVPAIQIFQLDKSHGADGMAVREGIGSVADLRGKTIAASVPGTSPYFYLAWILAENGLSLRDVTVVNMEPGPAAQAFIAGQNDAAMTYEPYLSSVRDAPQAGRILVTTLDYPAVMDTFGCTPAFLDADPEAAKALAHSYSEALALIAAEPERAYEIMGADVNQTGAQFATSAGFLEWQDLSAAKAFFEGEYLDFANKAADLLVDMGLIREKPDVAALIDTQFVE